MEIVERLNEKKEKERRGGEGDDSQCDTLINKIIFRVGML